MIRKLFLNKLIQGAILLLPVLLLSSCNKNAKPLTALEARGKTAYVSNCTTCHNPDPRLVGSVGPEIADSSLELLRARVIHQKYPDGYKPKRTSVLMPALPFLEKDIEALHAYLKSFIKK
ncbi:MAG: cytochrome c [Alphaproteobacteria bacterium]|nr:MAG: cytochrome c [Alphaproteobacteria bacterium]